MKLDRLTLSGFQPLFRRLMTAYQHRIPDTWLEETIKTYFDPLRTMPESIVEQAVSMLIEDPAYKYFPKANQLVGMCRRLLKERDATAASQHQVTRCLDQCDSCRTEYRMRTWLSARIGEIGRKNPSFEFERADGTLIPMLTQKRLLCDCRWTAQQSRLSADEVSAMNLQSTLDRTKAKPALPATTPDHGAPV